MKGKLLLKPETLNVEISGPGCAFLIRVVICAAFFVVVVVVFAFSLFSFC